MTIGDLYLALRADGAKLLPEVVKEAEKAGDAGGKAMGQRMTAQLKTGAGLAVRAVGAALATLATGRLIALDRAMADFRAETGATAEEAKAAGKAINAMAGSNLQDIEEIGRALTKVRTDLGVSGEEAEKLTDRFLKFGRVTKQDAADAVLAFDDILDNWGLTAADAEGLMNQLIVSHQRYGGIIADNEKTLAALAPALRAANFEIDDGIALLGLFGAKGLNAEVAAAAFAKALTKVKSPEELQAAIVDIANTEDAFERADKAAELFGARAGAKLANALGGVDLASFRVGVEDAAGALDKAADASLTLGDRVKLAVKGLTSALGDLGLTDLGPLILGLTTLGSLGGGKVVKAFLGPLRSLGTLTADLIVKAIGFAIVPATIAGERVGAATGGGIASGIAASKAKVLAAVASLAVGAIVIIPIAFEIRNGERDKALRELDAWTQELIKRYRGGLLDKDAIAEAQSVFRLKSDEFWDTPEQKAEFARIRALWDNELRDIAGYMEQRKGEIAAAAVEITEAVGTEFETGGQKVGAALIGSISASIAAHQAQIRGIALRTGRAGVQAFITAITSRRAEVDTAWSNLLDTIKRNKGPEDAKALGRLVSKELAHALKSNDPLIRATAKETQRIFLERLGELVPENGKLGKKAQDELNKALKSKDPEVRAQAENTAKLIEEGLLPDTKKVGNETGDAITDALRNAQSPIGKAAYSVGRLIAANVAAGVRGGKPVSGSSGGGSGSASGQFGGGGPNQKKAIGGPVEAGRMYLVGEHGPEPFVPARRGVIVPTVTALAAAAAAPAGGDTYQVNLLDRMPARSVRDIGAGLRMLGEQGYLAPRRKREAR